MKKNSTLEKRLLKYSSVAGALVAVGNTANAQIVYTDVNPDAVVTGNQMGVQIDMNNDATNDFVIVTLDNSTTYTTYYTGIGNLNINAVYKGALFAASSGNSWMGAATTSNNVQMLNLNDAIDGAQIWKTNTASSGGTMAMEGTVDITTTGGSPVYNGPISQGLFAGATDQYIGVKFTVGANVYYGWVRVDVSADGGTVTLKDYAYNSTANTSLLAGQTVVSVQENLEQFVTVRNLNNNLMVAVNGDLSNGKVNISSVSGQEVAGHNVVSGNNIISLEGLSAGIYVVTVQFTEGVMTKKIFVR